MGERQFGPYRLVRQIAVGGMAEIHLAKTKGIAGFEKYVALKMIHPNFAEDDQFIQMLVDEAKIAVQLNHGNIAQTFDLGRVGETFYITMEYVDGADLYKILRRGSEMDFEMPLDVCAFVAKEVASALDHAHRKKDHAGKNLGIVHRDVSPQNVLISFSGEVKLVDFGIAKATMKARQTAAGVIKGKYYYMSPEQAWGDPIDYRSDIFSAGIVLYEMITGQMLYLEEDLHKLLDMARRADIKPPSTLRKGIPPQLEKIVMHALSKAAGDRYASAGDFASDLERFLHAYSPVFTATKLSSVVKKIVGDPTAVPDAEYQVEVRDGPVSTHTLSSEDLIHSSEELKDENSVIFRVADLKPKEAPRPRTPSAGAAAVPKSRPPTTGAPAGRVTRQSEPQDGPPPRPAPFPASSPGKIPSIANPTRQKVATPRSPTPATSPQPVAVSRPARPPTKSRGADEHTREVAPVGGLTEDSGLLGLTTPPPVTDPWTDALETHPGGDHGGDDLENIGERTMITGAPSAVAGGGYMMDVASEEGIDATIVNAGPPQRPDAGDEEAPDDGETMSRQAAPEDDDGDGPTIQRDFRESAKPKVGGKRAPGPAALAAKIHAPAVSELRKPRASRKTPGTGLPQASVLQAIVGSQVAEPMPVPRQGPPRTNDDSGATTLAPQGPPPQMQHPSAQMQQQMPPQAMINGYATDASGMPMATQTPPQGYPVVAPPQQPPYAMQQPQYPQPYPPQQTPPQGYANPYQTPPQGAPQAYPPQQTPPQGYPNPQMQGYPGYPPQPGYGYPPQQQVSPGALYQLQPYGAAPPKPMTLTGQLRLFEADEFPSQYKVSGGGAKWLKLLIAGVLAISVAAGVTFFIVRSRGDNAPTVGSVHIESVPPGAEVVFDGSRLSDKTPLTVDGVPVGTKHDVRVELGRHRAYTETVNIPKTGQETSVTAVLQPITGKLRVVSHPDGAEIYIDGHMRGRAPTTINDIDMDSARTLELRLKDYQPYVAKLQWPANGEIDIDQKLSR